MRVIVWTGHGITDVYAIDTAQQRQRLRDDMLACARHFPKEDQDSLERNNSVTGMINWALTVAVGDDSFEKFECMKVKE
jgi:hypothetical protein